MMSGAIVTRSDEQSARGIDQVPRPPCRFMLGIWERDSVKEEWRLKRLGSGNAKSERSAHVQRTTRTPQSSVAVLVKGHFRSLAMWPTAYAFIPSASFTASTRPTEHRERRTCIAVKLQGSLPLRDHATPATLAVADTVAAIWPSIAIAHANGGFIVLSH
jgi:hypothetical protein